MVAQQRLRYQRSMFGDVPLEMVSDSSGVESLVRQLEAAPVIAIDTESNGMFAYTERVCLIQFSVVGRDWIVDPLAFENPREALAPLGPVIADPDKPTVLHGADYDVRCLRRDFDWSIGGMFDTLIAAQLLAFDKVGLADLLERFFGLDVDKQFQRHDWGRRPLQPRHLDYARGDTHYLMALKVLLERRLEAIDRLHHHREECEILQSLEFEERELDPEDAYFLKGSDKLDDKAKRVLRRLWLLREHEAERLDRPTYKTIPNRVLIDLARRQPTDDQALDKVLKPKSALRRRFGPRLLEAVQQGLEDDQKVPKRRKAKKKPPRQGPKPRNRGKQVDRIMEVLRNWRNDLTKTTKRYTPYNAVSNAVLRNIAAHGPRDLDELRAVPDVRNWQVEEFGEQLLEKVAEAD